MLGSHFEEQLRNVERVQATSSAFAALLEDGSVVTWGDPGFGGDSSAVRKMCKRFRPQSEHSQQSAKTERWLLGALRATVATAAGSEIV